MARRQNKQEQETRTYDITRFIKLFVVGYQYKSKVVHIIISQNFERNVD